MVMVFTVWGRYSRLKYPKKPETEGKDEDSVHSHLDYTHKTDMFDSRPELDKHQLCTYQQE